MTYPIDRLLNYLKTVDEVQILELLDLSTEDILDRFHDRVASRRHYLEKELEVLYEEEEYKETYDYTDEDS
jgi:hypothetical protein